jgi:hypothetical protein
MHTADCPTVAYGQAATMNCEGITPQRGRSR